MRSPNIMLMTVPVVVYLFPAALVAMIAAVFPAGMVAWMFLVSSTSSPIRSSQPVAQDAPFRAG